MSLIIELAELKAIIEDAAKVAVAAYIREKTPARDRISQRKAYEMFGESRVKGWVSRRQIRPIREGDARNSTCYYSIADLRTLLATENAQVIINRRRKAV
ncbi:MAG: hypothetical protein K2K82_07745 [Muribaculaceae bacterium]|nr:hypothetical protein [Muribaculaceae bacterium]